ncbi:MAG: polysaccharide deacetylase family protein [Bradyrhizobium sp.]|uniref:polysaccharide deacetylase family protein n=1 Tax=Bradyrhizobium sp. TaxID=376 RepID=UPI0025B82055|nr:polysaccharide deacetylase family protein [Bradyrhizobium sp.]MBI5264891.1 polysaccharide deacetylase family protein [Bradyrhizobium sp.]
MTGSGWARFQTRSWIGLCIGLAASSTVGAAPAADCPGHPDALGTSRTIVVDPREHPRIGTMQYPETLPLRDHEVVLTFDDGPLPKYSNQVLAILAAECIKATFFIIGTQAQANPDGVRKLAAAGHTIGTHSQNHPLTFQKMPIEKAEQEINDGIASTSAALTDPSTLTPFFRIPGLLRAQGVEDYLAARGIQVWSADFPADDWRHVSSARVYQLAMQRIEAKGKGILLLHDIQSRTVAALPKILRDLKARGYHIVHVVPATAERPATPTDPLQWRLHPPAEEVSVAQWPKVPHFVFASAEALPAPAWWSLSLSNDRVMEPELSLDRAGHAQTAPQPRGAPWPRPGALPQENAALTLPIPGLDLFDVQTYAALRVAAAQPHRAGQVIRPEKQTRLLSAYPGYDGPPQSQAAAAARRHAYLSAKRRVGKGIHGGHVAGKQPARHVKERRAASDAHRQLKTRYTPFTASRS